MVFTFLSSIPSKEMLKFLTSLYHLYIYIYIYIYIFCRIFRYGRVTLNNCIPALAYANIKPHFLGMILDKVRISTW